MSENEAPDTPPAKVVFREKAHRLYVQNQQKIVLLKLARPKLFPVYWTLLGALAVSIALAWSAQIPVTLTGTGLIVESVDETIILSLLPPHSLDQVSTSQEVQLFDERGSEPLLTARVLDVSTEVLSPAEIRERFALDPDLADLVEQPAVVAVAKIDSVRTDTDLDDWIGGRTNARVVVGSKPVLQLVPGVRDLLPEEDS
ncbi:MAG: hypothetical protein AAGD38_24600 [Acidobacteriota bacterium]